MLADALSGLRQPTADEVAFVKTLNEKFMQLEKPLGAVFRAYCGGTHGYMVRRFIEGCDPADTLSSHRPIGMGPKGLEAYFRRHYGIGWETFLTTPVADLVGRLQSTQATKPAVRKDLGAKKKSASSKPKVKTPTDTLKSCPPLNADGSRCTTPACLKQLDEECDRGQQTLDAHMVNGRLSADRKKLHDRIIDDIRKGSQCVPSTDGPNRPPLAILMGGAPGSGKSSFVRKHAPWINEPGKLHIDADAIRAMLPEYRGWNATMTHAETKIIVDRLIGEIGVPCNADVVYDGTMNNPGKYGPIVRRLKDLGYDVVIIYIDVDEATSRKRVIDRYERSGRYVPSSVIDEFFAGKRSSDALNKLIQSVDGYVVLRNEGSTYKPVEYNGLKANNPFGDLLRRLLDSDGHESQEEVVSRAKGRTTVKPHRTTSHRPRGNEESNDRGSSLDAAEKSMAELKEMLRTLAQ
jgi:predicted ABC-type ATPase